MARPTPARRKKRLGRTPQATAEFNTSRATLYRWAELGLITRYKIGGTAYWDLDEIADAANPVHPNNGDAA